MPAPASALGSAPPPRGAATATAPGLLLHLATGCGEAIVRGAIVGLADSLPEPSWPCVADVLAPSAQG